MGAVPASPAQVMAAQHTRLPSLTGMRFVAAVLVFATHGIFVNVLADEAVLAGYRAVAINLGSVGVSFFFILSGFVLTYVAPPGDSLKRFWRRRFFKIYPNHVLLFGVTALLAGLPALWLWLPNLLLLHGWWPNYQLMTSMNAVSWTLSCELLFYALFPLLHHWICRIRPGNLGRWLGGVIAVTILIPILSHFVIPVGPKPIASTEIGLYELWFSTHFPPTRALEFLLGMLCARMLLLGLAPRIGLGASTAVLVACYVPSLWLPPVFTQVAMWTIPLALLTTALARADVEGSFSPLRGRTLVFLGDTTYAFYLTHAMILGTVTYTVQQFAGPGSVGLGVLVLVGCFVLALGVAALLYVGWERPIMRRFSRPGVAAARTR